MSQAIEKLDEERSELFDNMVAMQASSLQGILAKARVIKMIHQDELQIELGETRDWQLASNLVMDMLALVENRQNETNQLEVVA